MTVFGALLAAFVVSAIGLVAVVLMRWAAGQKRLLWPLPLTIVFAVPLVFLGGLFVAEQIVPGFEVRGFWNYAFTAVVIWLTSEALDFFARRVALV